MDAETERQMPPRVGPADVEPFGIGEDAFVAIARDVPHDDLVAGLDHLATDFGIGDTGPPHVRQRCLPADDFGDSSGDLRLVVDQLLPFAGILMEGVCRSRHRIARRVIAADDEQDEIAHAFLEVHVAHRIGMRHQRDEIGGRWQGLSFREQPVEIMGHVDQVLLAHILGGGVERGFDVAAPVRPQGQLATVLPGEIEQDGEHLGGQFDADGVNPIEFGVERQRIEQFDRPLPHALRHAGDLGRTEGRGDDAALLAMAGPVHGDELRQVEFAKQVDNGDAAEDMAR